MRGFRIYIETRDGRLTAFQAEQLKRYAAQMKYERADIVFVPGKGRAGLLYIRGIMRAVKRCFGGSGMILSVIVLSKGSFLAEFAAKRVNASLIPDLRALPGDISRIENGCRPGGCAFSSCLGNTVYLRDSSVALCPLAESVALNPLKEGAPVKTVFDTEAFKRLLVNHIEKRRVCAKNCERYALCRGGCPVEGGCGLKNTKDKTAVDALEIAAERLSQLLAGE